MSTFDYVWVVACDLEEEVADLVLEGFVCVLFFGFADFPDFFFGDVGCAVFLEGFFVEVSVPEEDVAVVCGYAFEASFGGFFGGDVDEVLVEFAHFAVEGGWWEVLEFDFLHCGVFIAWEWKDLS